MSFRKDVMPFLFGFGAGAVCAALLDPFRGAARRALVRDKARHFALEGVEEAERLARDYLHRATGRLYELRHRDELVPDDLLLERVRAQLGRPLSNPRAVEVRCEDGVVVLTGEAPSWEIPRLLEILRKVRGVVSIRNELRIHDRA